MSNILHLTAVSFIYVVLCSICVCCDSYAFPSAFVATSLSFMNHNARFVSTVTIKLRRRSTFSTTDTSNQPILHESIRLLHINRRRIIRLLSSAMLSSNIPISGISMENEERQVSMSSAQLQPNRKSLRQVLKVGDNHGKRGRSDVQVVGHRGAIHEHLENTIESFIYCADSCQCNAVELDVFVIKDGTLVVFHGCDSNPNIPGSLHGYFAPDINNSSLVLENDGCTYRSILDLTYEETQQLQFNPNYKEFVCPKERVASAKIPKLHEVLLQLSKTNLQEVKIELKGPGTVEPVLSLVEQLQLETLCSYSSFDHEQLQELRTLRPNKLLYRTGALFNAPVPSDCIHRAQKCGATAIHLRYDDCTVERIQSIHDNNLVSMAWFRGPMGMKYDALNRFDDIGGGDDDLTELDSSDDNLIIENAACYRTLLDTDVQQICCNRPDALMKLLSEQ